MSFSENQSLLGLYDSVRPATGRGPLQAFAFATLYSFYGGDALGYHIWNAFLLVTIAALLYFVLRELHLPRRLCVAVPFLYSIPHHGTNSSGWTRVMKVGEGVARGRQRDPTSG